MGKFANSIIFAIACLVAMMSSGAHAQKPLPADKVFHLAVQRDGDSRLLLNWTILPGNYLYRDQVAVRLPGKALTVVTSQGEMKDDPNFGPTEIYHDRAEAHFATADIPPGATLQIRYQGCAEQGICYPPITKALDLATLDLSDVATGPGGDAISSSETSQIISGSAVELVPGGTDIQPISEMSGNLALVLVSFLGFGLLLSLTPCVFPMIPILSGMLARSGEALSASRGLVLSASYVIAMAAAYAALGLAAAWSGQNLQAALQTPWALGLMAAVFAALALSMFGLFELQLPAGWISRLSRRSPGRAGSVAGSAALGFGSALIVGPCVTPPLAAALLYVAQTGDGIRGAAALFALGLGMGLPLVVYGTFGSRYLPRSGPWLVRIKQIFGVVFLGLAASMILRLVPDTVVLPVWGTIALGTGVFLGAFDRLATSSNWVLRMEKTVGLAIAIYGTTLIIGFAGGATDPLRPLTFLVRDSGGTAGSFQGRVVSTEAAFNEVLATSRQDGRPLLVFFTADWCTVCKSNERVLAEPSLAASLAAISIIKADVTANSADSRRLMKRFGVVGPPTMFLLDTSGEEVAGTRTIGAITAEGFARRLKLAGM
nr:protein-disulfide reductase DsbD [Phyllobacterium myrsinacearum]